MDRVLDFAYRKSQQLNQQLEGGKSWNENCEHVLLNFDFSEEEPGLFHKNLGAFLSTLIYPTGWLYCFLQLGRPALCPVLPGKIIFVAGEPPTSDQTE